jgi:serine/threonine protein kinase
VTVTDDLTQRYELGECIGRGGLADVYEAIDTATRERVAIKVLRSVEVNDARRFEMEGKVLEALDHPGIVRLREVGSDAEDRPFLALDLVEGTTLSGLLADGAIECDRAIEIGADLADALAHAHARGIVHRDVKPSNILLDATGRIRLSDFGIARLVDSNATTGITATGFVIGTAAYLAPEQVRGDPVTAAVDVYALGLVLLECCNGERAFAGSSLEAAMARLTRSPEMADDMPEWCKTLVRSMTAQEPSQRPSAATVARALSARAYGDPGGDETEEIAVTQTIAEPTMAFQLPPDTGEVTDLSSPADPQPEPQFRPRRASRLPTVVLLGIAAVVLLAAFALVSARRDDAPRTGGSQDPAVLDLDDALDNLEDSVR